MGKAYLSRQLPWFECEFDPAATGLKGFHCELVSFNLRTDPTGMPDPLIELEITGVGASTTVSVLSHGLPGNAPASPGLTTPVNPTDVFKQALIDIAKGGGWQGSHAEDVLNDMGVTVR